MTDRTGVGSQRCVIVNVDDVGLHPAVQRAVEAGIEKGIVTSASVLANGPSVKNARQLKGIGLAAHLNILRGAPISSPHEIKSLTKHGMFLNDNAKLFERYLLRQLKLEEIELEWDRQIQLLLEMGLPLTHLDSEKHVHCWPRLMPIVCRLAARHGLGYVRRTVEQTNLSRWNGGSVKARLLNIWGMFHRQHLDVCWPDAVWGVADTGEEFTPQRFADHLPQISQAQVIEIICHPGSPEASDGPVDSAFGTLRVEDSWITELQSLLAGNWHDVFDQHQLQLTHYGKIESSNPSSISAPNFVQNSEKLQAGFQLTNNSNEQTT